MFDTHSPHPNSLIIPGRVELCPVEWIKHPHPHAFHFIMMTREADHSEHTHAQHCSASAKHVDTTQVIGKHMSER